MANKFIYWAIIGVIISGILGILYWVVKPMIYGNNMEFYIRLGLLLIGGIMFGVLRMYNAIVSNTRFLIKLRQTIAPINNELINNKAILNRLGGRVGKNTDTLKHMGESMTRLQEAMSKLGSSINHATDKNNRR